MNRSHTRRVAQLATIALGSLVLLATPVAAQSTSRDAIMSLNQKLLILGIPIGVFMIGLLIYTILRFRTNEEPKPTGENRALEISWTVATALVLLFVGLASYQVMAEPAVTAPQSVEQVHGDPVEVTITGQQFLWVFNYPEHNITTSQELVLPANQTIFIRVKSRDVIHAVHVPALGLKSDAIPGQTNTLQTTISEQGTYTLFCAEYCGQGHSKMLSTVRVVSPSAYEDWIANQTTEGT